MSLCRVLRLEWSGLTIRDSLLLQGDQSVSFISSHATMDAEHMATLRQALNTVDDEAPSGSERRIDAEGAYRHHRMESALIRRP